MISPPGLIIARRSRNFEPSHARRSANFPLRPARRRRYGSARGRGWGRGAMSDVFISYARSTAKQAQAVGEALRSLGYAVWRDDELPAHRS